MVLPKAAGRKVKKLSNEFQFGRMTNALKMAVVTAETTRGRTYSRPLTSTL